MGAQINQNSAAAGQTVQSSYTTTDLCVKFKRTARTFLRWQSEKWPNPFPKPISASKGADNVYSAKAVDAWEAAGGLNAQVATSNE